MIETALASGGWLMAAVVGLVAAGAALRGWRRRAELNEALHELRRPLQAMALTPAFDGWLPPGETPVDLAAAALRRLERQINGGPIEPALGEARARALAEAAVGRWRARAALAGAEIALRWHAGDATVRGDRVALAQALDNLIVNAIEHGGPAISVEGESGGRRLTIVVADSGREAGGAAGGAVPGRGHGLDVVRRTAAAHGGRFMFSRSAGGSRAVLELPLASGSLSAA